MSLLNNLQSNIKKGSTQSAIDQMPGDEQSKEPMLDVSHPASNLQWKPLGQLPSYDKGGDVPKDQVAEVHEGERVLNPVETHAYKSAALGNPPPTSLGRIAARAHELYNQGKALMAPEDNEAKAFAEKQKNIEEGLDLRPVQPNAPAEMPVIGGDKMNPDARYGDRGHEKRMFTDEHGEVVDPTTPNGLGAVGPQRPVPEGLKPLPSYDDGGDVPNDQVAQVHEDEHVLDPEKAAAYRQAEAEEKQSQVRRFPEPASGPVQPKLDTEPAGTTDKPVGANMYEVTAKTPLGPQLAPKSASVRPLPHAQALKVEAEGVKPREAEVSAPDINSIIQQDKLAAAKKGAAGLADLGTSLIHENVFAKPAYTGTAKEMKQEKQEEGKERYEQTVADLKEKMLHGATEQERFQAEKDLAQYKLHTPWGGDESAHPGTLGKVGHILGRIGQTALMPVAPYVNAMLPGSQMGLEEQSARGEAGAEQAQHKEMTKAQIATEQQKPEIKQAQADVAEQKLQNAQTALLRKQGLKVDAAGNQVPLTYEEMSLPEQGAYDLQQAKSNAQNAIAELKKAQADPDSPQSQAILQKAKNEARRIDIAAQKVGIDADKYKADYLGVDHDGNPLTGVETDAQGKPIGPKIAKGNETTSQRLNKADLAQNVQLNIKNTKALIDKNPDIFGKAAGRITTVEQLIGSDDPALGEIPVMVYNIGLAAGGIHSQRGLAAAQHAAQLLLNSFKNGPEATKAALDEMGSSVQTFIDAAKAGKHVAPSPTETPKSPKAGEKTPFQQWKEQQNKP